MFLVYVVKYVDDELRDSICGAFDSQDKADIHKRVMNDQFPETEHWVESLKVY